VSRYVGKLLFKRNLLQLHVTVNYEANVTTWTVTVTFAK